MVGFLRVGKKKVSCTTGAGHVLGAKTAIPSPSAIGTIISLIYEYRYPSWVTID